MSVTVESTRSVRVRASLRGGASWALLRFEDSTGWVNITSDYGHWTYHWHPNHRSESLGNFLSHIDRDYAAGKFLGGAAAVYDQETTARHVRYMICSYRRDGTLSKERARQEWDHVELLNESRAAWLAMTRLPNAFDMYCTVIDHSFQNFWSRLWDPMIKPQLARWPAGKEDAREFEEGIGP